MKFSKRGAKDNRVKLVWSKYFKYIVENKEYYFKQKAYATYCDGWKDSQKITKQTYKNAIKRGNECIEIILEEDMSETPLDHLVSIFSEEYAIDESIITDIILKAKAAIEKIKEDSSMNTSTEYMVFKRILNSHINSSKENIAR